MQGMLFGMRRIWEELLIAGVKALLHIDSIFHLTLDNQRNFVANRFNVPYIVRQLELFVAYRRKQWRSGVRSTRAGFERRPRPGFPLLPLYAMCHKVFMVVDGDIEHCVDVQQESGEAMNVEEGLAHPGDVQQKWYGV